MGFSSPSRKLPVDEKWIPVAKNGMNNAPCTMKNVPIIIVSITPGELTIYIPYVKKSAHEKVFPMIHSPTPPKIWTMPPKKMNTGLYIVNHFTVTTVRISVLHDSSSLPTGTPPSHHDTRIRRRSEQETKQRDGRGIA